ncbi:hypothetical protein CsSME_00048263 [Camellia sinensis var. sinensis]
MALLARNSHRMALVASQRSATNLSHLAFDTVHNNPSDLSSWLESMITELNPLPEFPPPVDDPFLVAIESSSTVTSVDTQNQYNQQNPYGRIFQDSSSNYFCMPDFHPSKPTPPRCRHPLLHHHLQLHLRR